MAVKRKRQSPGAKAAAEAYEQAMLAEGAPAALDLLGLGTTIGDLVLGRSRKSAKKRRPTKRRTKRKVRATAKAPRTKSKAKARKARRRT